jgi:hypothetical protein
LKAGAWNGALRLVVAPVEDPVGDKVNIVLPQDASQPPQLVDGVVKVQSTAPAVAVTSPITWNIVCFKNYPSGEPCPASELVDITINPTTGALTGAANLLQTTTANATPTPYYENAYYVTADWTTAGKPNHLVQCLYGSACDNGRWITDGPPGVVTLR